MKLVRTIVSQHHKLIGFELEGQAWEFGDIGKELKRSNMVLSALRERQFSNFQVEINAKNIIEKGGFKLNNLPMAMYDGTNLVDIDNTIRLERRILIDGKLGGFDCYVGGKKARLTSQAIISLSGWFRTEDFVIRYRDNIRFIAGTAGHSIENLPVEELTSTGVDPTGKKATRSATEGGGKGTVAQHVSPFDMINLSKILSELGGQFLYLPGTGYTRTLSEKARLNSEFKKTGVEICKPEIAYSEKTLNISLPFKQIGRLLLNVGGYDKTYYPYAFKNKVVFEAGKLNSPHLGIAINKSALGELQSRFGQSLSLSIINDQMTNMYVKNFLNLRNPDEIALLSLNTANLSAMSLENAKAFHLNESEILEIEKKLIHTKVLSSWLRGVAKGAEEASKNGTGVSPRPLYGPFSILSQIELEALNEAGVDVFNGAFVKVEEVPADTSSAHAGKVIKESQDVYAEFGVAGYKTLPTYAKITKGDISAEKFGDEIAFINSFKARLEKENTLEGIYKVTKAQLDLVTSEKDELVKKLWLSNMASLTLGDGSSFHVAHKESWEAGKSLKGGNAYSYTGNEAEGLTLNLYGLRFN